MSLVTLVTGAGSGVGKESAHALARAGHAVYATLRDVDGHNADEAEALRAYGDEHGLDLRVAELDVQDQGSIDRAVRAVLEERGRIDVVVHNAAQAAWGVTEAYSAEQLAALYDTNVVGTHRLNRAVLPSMRAAESGLLLYVGSTTARVRYPLQGPYQATKAAADALAETVRYEVARWGIDVVVLTPGAIMDGTEHFDKGAAPDDEDVTMAYDRLAGMGDRITERLNELTPEDAGGAAAVGEEVARIVGLPLGARPFRPMIDFLDDGAGEVNGVMATMQARLMERLGLGDLLRPTPAR